MVNPQLLNDKEINDLLVVIGNLYTKLRAGIRVKFSYSVRIPVFQALVVPLLVIVFLSHFLSLPQLIIFYTSLNSLHFTPP